MSLGDNGQGKSNLLEALSLAIQGESFRSFENKYLIKNNELKANINIEKANNLDFKLQTSLEGNLRSHFCEW